MSAYRNESAYESSVGFIIVILIVLAGLWIGATIARYIRYRDNIL